MIRPTKRLSSSFTLSLLFVFACKGDSRSNGDTASAANVTFTNDGPFDYDARVFVADEDSSGLFLCFAAKETALAPEMPVTVVFAGFPQHSTVGRLSTRRRMPCFPPSPMPPLDSMQYVVQIPRDTLDRIGIPIVVLGPVSSPKQVGDTVTLALERGQRPIRFRVCAGTEGLNASAWAGIPLASPMKWHGYYYLGYDVDPSCKEGEYAPDSSVKNGGTR